MSKRILFFSAVYCQTCKVYEHQVFSKVDKSQVDVQKIDVTQPESAELMTEWGVSSGIPVIVLLDDPGDDKVIRGWTPGKQARVAKYAGVRG